MAGDSSWPLDAGLPPEPAGSAGGGVGRGAAPDRALTGRAPAAGHPLAGQAGPDPLDPLPWPEPPPLMGGAEPRSRERAWLLTGAEDAGETGDAARGRGPAPVPALVLVPAPTPAPAPTERPAPRDQPEADPAAPVDPFDPFDPFDPLPERGGRSRGGATRVPPVSASATFLARAEPDPLTPVTPRREPELTSPSPSPSPSAGGGASGRSRDA